MHRLKSKQNEANQTPHGTARRLAARERRTFGIKMKTLSRYIPAAPEHKITPLGYVMLALFCLGLAVFCYHKPIVLPFIAALLVVGWLLTRIENKRLRKVAETRKTEGICEFARSFSRKETDPWIIRAVYEELEAYLKGDVDHFPIRASDRIDEDLRIDREDLDGIAYDIAHRAGYDMTDAQKNPYFNKVKTVADIVTFMTNQPKKRTAEPSPGLYGSGVTFGSNGHMR